MVAALCLSLAVGNVFGSDCDSFLVGRKITIQVPIAAGGTYDLMARALIEPMNSIGKVKVTVENKPALDGWLALKQIAKSQERDIQIGLFEAKKLIQLTRQKSLTWDGTWVPLYTFVRQDSVWLTRANNSNEILAVPYIAFAGSLTDRLEAAAVAKLLKKELKIITSYSGVADLAAATLRREVDYFGPVISTANRLMKSGDYRPALVLGKALPGEYQKTPYLIGPGNVTQNMFKAQEMRSSQELAIKINRIAQSNRMIISGYNNGTRLNQCIEQLIDHSFRSEIFLKKVDKFGFSLIHEGQAPSRKYLQYIQQDITDLERFIHHD
jgi:hypothetical protein